MASSAGRRRVAFLLSAVALVVLIFLWAGASVARSVVAVEQRGLTQAALERQEIEPPGTPAEQIDALIAYVLAEDLPLEERSRAIWLLGRLRAESAEGPLESFLESEECASESVCQDEVRRTLRRIRREDGAFSRLGDRIVGSRLADGR
ncbi:MAG: hypothetical protein AAGK22_09050 [Acidobacteriota bacterium]